jgi:hypothetical protein
MMSYDRLIKVTNKVAFYATCTLFYWVFVFLIITVFDLRIFKERMTEMFYIRAMGVLGKVGPDGVKG